MVPAYASPQKHRHLERRKTKSHIDFHIIGPTFWEIGHCSRVKTEEAVASGVWNLEEVSPSVPPEGGRLHSDVWRMQFADAVGRFTRAWCTCGLTRCQESGRRRKTGSENAPSSEMLPLQKMLPPRHLLQVSLKQHQIHTLFCPDQPPQFLTFPPL